MEQKTVAARRRSESKHAKRRTTDVGVGVAVRHRPASKQAKGKTTDVGVAVRHRSAKGKTERGEMSKGAAKKFTESAGFAQTSEEAKKMLIQITKCITNELVGVAARKVSDENRHTLKLSDMQDVSRRKFGLVALGVQEDKKVKRCETVPSTQASARRKGSEFQKKLLSVEPKESKKRKKSTGDTDTKKKPRKSKTGDDTREKKKPKPKPKQPKPKSKSSGKDDSAAIDATVKDVVARATAAVVAQEETNAAKGEEKTKEATPNEQAGELGALRQKEQIAPASTAVANASTPAPRSAIANFFSLVSQSDGSEA